MVSAITLLVSLLVSNVPTPINIQNNTCNECIHTIDVLKNETAFLSNITSDVEYICGKIYGPAAHECVIITDDMRKSLDYLCKHNSTIVCHHLNYC
jgi:hypothetical protein